MSTTDRIIGYVFTTDTGDVKRPIYEQPDGRQYIHDDEGEQVFGVWLIPEVEPDVRIIADWSG